MKKLTKIEKEVKIEKDAVIESINELNIKLNLIEDLIHSKSSKFDSFAENINHRLNAVFELISHRSQELKKNFLGAEEYITKKINLQDDNQFRLNHLINKFDDYIKDIIQNNAKDSFCLIPDKPYKVNYFQVSWQVLCLMVFFVGLIYSVDSIIGLFIHLSHFRI